MFLRKSLFGVMGIILACGMIAFAQEPQPQSPTTQDGNLSRDESSERSDVASGCPNAMG